MVELGSVPAVQEVVVTGERVARPLSETASSVVVMTADGIATQPAPHRLEDVVALVPNVQFGSGSIGPTIRGQDSTGVLVDLPAFLGGTRPRVTVQVDGRAIGYNEFVFGIASVWDVRQVEVFRSPQTTTQGRNAIAGAIFVSTEDPTYAWEGRARAIGGERDTWQGSVAFSGPIVRDELAFRFAADARFARPASRIADRMAGASPDHEAYGLARLKLLAEPAALPGLRVDLSLSHLESQAPQLEGIRPPFRARRDPLDGYGVFRTVVNASTAEFEYRPSAFLLSTMTLTYSDSAIQRFAPPGLGQTQIGSQDASVETLLKWRRDDAVQVVGGAHYLRTRLHQAIDVTALVGLGKFEDTQHSLGVFGEVTWKAHPKLTVTAGLRRQSDDQRRTGVLGTFRTDYDETFQAWLPKVSLAYDAAPGVTVGVLVQRAFNPGGTTLNVDTGEQDVFGAETLWAYEAFVRAALAGGRLRLSANAFYNDIHDAQRPQTLAIARPDGALTFHTEFDNAPAAETYGLELQADWRMDETLSLGVAVGLLQTEIRQTRLPQDPLRGNAFQRSPALTASAVGAWRPVEGLQVSAQMRRNSGYYSDDANTPELRIRSATVVDARVAYRAGPVTLFGYVRNAFDTFRVTWMFSPTLATANEPRTIGLGIEAHL